MHARILAIDYGRARIGVAVSDALGLSPHPLAAVLTGSRKPGPGVWAEVARRLAAVAADHDVRRLVVGLPLNMDGSEGPMAAEARRFAEALGSALGLEAELEDERLTSDEAEAFLREAGLRPSERKKVRDSVAAAILLRGVLEREAG